MHAEQRVLIVGCGYVGSALGRYLHAGGHRVFGLRRDTTRLPEEIEPLSIDLLDREALARMPGGWDHVIYLTGASERTMAAYREAYVVGFMNLLVELEGRGEASARLIFASSTGVYGQADGSWVQEDTRLEPSSGPIQYLMQGEELAEHSSVASIAVRFGGIYGPGRCSLLKRIRLGETTDNDNSRRYTNRIHRDDCVGVLHHLMGLENPYPTYIAVDDEPVEAREVSAWLASVMEVPWRARPDGAGPLRPGPNRRCRNTRLKESGYVFRYPSFREGYGKLLEDPENRG